MDRKIFEQRINEILNQYAPSKVFMAPRIASRFNGNEEVVLQHLTKKYGRAATAEATSKKYKAAGGPPMGPNKGEIPE